MPVAVVAGGVSGVLGGVGSGGVAGVPSVVVLGGVTGVGAMVNRHGASSLERSPPLSRARAVHS